MRVATYSRISTLTHGQSTDLQVNEMNEFIKRRGWTLTAEFADRGISGARERRPQLDLLMEAARRRKIDVVLVYRYDRFARSLRHLVNALNEFDTLGIHFISLHEGVDTSTPNGRLVFGIFASIAEFERELLRGRILSGLAAARARGVKFGRPSVTVDTEEVSRLRASGESWRSISKRLGVARDTIRKSL